jgi:hypothetical protein
VAGLENALNLMNGAMISFACFAAAVFAIY